MLDFIGRALDVSGLWPQITPITRMARLIMEARNGAIGRLAATDAKRFDPIHPFPRRAMG